MRLHFTFRKLSTHDFDKPWVLTANNQLNSGCIAYKLCTLCFILPFNDINTSSARRCSFKTFFFLHFRQYSLLLLRNPHLLKATFCNLSSYNCTQYQEIRTQSFENHQFVRFIPQMYDLCILEIVNLLIFNSFLHNIHISIFQIVFVSEVMHSLPFIIYTQCDLRYCETLI